MNRSSIRCIVLALSLSLAVGFSVKACSSPELVETFGEKSEWSILQGIEFQTRETPLSEPVVRMVFDHEVLGVKGASGENIWILLRTESPPFYKQMPEGQYDLPVALVEKLNHETSSLLHSRRRAAVACPSKMIAAALPRIAPTYATAMLTIQSVVPGIPTTL
ncbi:MAG: hypothetical protein M3R60_08465 [Pseudomonadota bacterium]|nr:hypothetical protein [Pseudomonadota bacterium]